MNEVKETEGIVTFVNYPVTLCGEQVKAGDKAPGFTATGAELEPVALYDFRGKVVILSVMPSIDTGVCQMQTKRFNSEATALSEDVVILTISKDLPFALGRYCAAEGIRNVKTLSDYQHSEFGLKYGFLIKENMLLARGIVVIDRNAQVVYAEYVPNIKNEPDYDKALAAAKSAI